MQLSLFNDKNRLRPGELQTILLFEISEEWIDIRELSHRTGVCRYRIHPCLRTLPVEIKRHGRGRGSAIEIRRRPTESLTSRLNRLWSF